MIITMYAPRLIGREDGWVGRDGQRRQVPLFFVTEADAAACVVDGMGYWIDLFEVVPAEVCFAKTGCPVVVLQAGTENRGRA